MGRRTFSGLEVVKVLVNTGGLEWCQPTVDHAQLYYEHPTNEEDRRQVTILLHDELRAGTLRYIAEGAGANDFNEFCAWVDRNAWEDLDCPCSNQSLEWIMLLLTKIE